VCYAADDKKLPDELQAVANKALDIATNCAKQLDGAWGDWHAAMIESGKKDAYDDYTNKRAVLNGFVKQSDAKYVYTLYPAGDAESSAYYLSTDGSEVLDEYGTQYEWEAEFTTAFKGTPVAASEAWKDDKDGSILISAYAPVHDTKGNVVAVLGVDYPAPEAAKYPEFVKAD